MSNWPTHSTTRTEPTMTGRPTKRTRTLQRIQRGRKPSRRRLRRTRPIYPRRRRRNRQRSTKLSLHAKTVEVLNTRQWTVSQKNVSIVVTMERNINTVNPNVLSVNGKTTGLRNWPDTQPGRPHRMPRMQTLTRNITLIHERTVYTDT
jgi:hypothetical protein